MAIAQRRRAEALVGLGVGVVPHAHMAEIEHPDDGGEDRVARQRAAREIGLDTLAQTGQRAAEIGTTLIFVRLLPGPEGGVIAILLAPLLVQAGRLDVAERIGAEPAFDISGRERDRVQPVDLGAIGDALALGLEIRPFVADLAARDAGAGLLDIDEVAGGDVAGGEVGRGGGWVQRDRAPGGARQREGRPVVPGQAAAGVGLAPIGRNVAAAVRRRR